MYYLKNVQFVVPHTNERFEFKDGDVDGLYEIINWQTTPAGELTYIQVGFYNSTAPAESRMTINNGSVIWNNDILEVSGENIDHHYHHIEMGGATFTLAFKIKVKSSVC